MDKNQNRKPIEKIVELIDNLDFKKYSNFAEKTDLKTIMHVYPEKSSSFVKGRSSSYDDPFDRYPDYVDRKSRETEEIINKTLEALGFSITTLSKSSLILQMLNFAYEETKKNLKLSEFNYYHNPSLILGHNFNTMSDNLINTIPETEKGILQQINAFYNSCLYLFEEVMNEHPEFDLVYVDKENLPLNQFYFDSVDLFLALLIIYWLIIIDNERTSDYLIHLKQFLFEFLRFENPSSNINFYLKSKYRFNLETNFIRSDLILQEDIEGLELSSFSSKNVSELIERFNSEKNLSVKLKILEHIEIIENSLVTKFLFTNLRNENKSISNLSLNIISRKKYEPVMLEDKIHYFGKLAQWDEIANLHTEESTNYLLNKFTELKSNFDIKGFELSKIRTSILKSLCNLKEDRITDLVIEATKEKEHIVRWDSIDLLGTIGSDKAIDYLFQLLKEEEKKKSADKHTMDKIFPALSKSNNKKAIDFLIEQIEKETNYKYRSLSVIGLSKDERVVELLIDKVDNLQDRYYSEKIIRSLAATKHPKALKKLQELASKSSSKVALEVLGHKPDEESLNLIKDKILNTKNTENRIKAISSFRWKYDKKKADILFDVYDRLEQNEKLEVGFTLGSMQGEWTEEHKDKRFMILNELLDRTTDPVKLKTLFLGIGYSNEGRLYPKFMEVIERPYAKNVRGVINFRMNKDMAYKNLLKAHNELVAKTPVLEDELEDTIALKVEKKKISEEEVKPEKVSVLTEEQENLLETRFLSNLEKSLDTLYAGKLMEIYEKKTYLRDLRQEIFSILLRMAERANLDDLTSLVDHKEDGIRVGGVVLAGLKRELKLFEKIKEIILNKDETPKIRKYAVEALRQIDRKESAPTLERCLDDEVKEVRMQATKEIIQIYDYKRKELPGIISDKKEVGIELVCDTIEEGYLDAWDIISAENHVLKVGVEAIPILAQKIDKTTNKDLRFFLADILGKFESKEAIPPLLNLIKDENKSVREFAIKSLIKIGDKSILNQLIQISEDNKEERSIRANALIGVGDLGSEKNLNLLEKYLKNPDYNYVSASSIGKIGGEKALSILINKYKTVSDKKLLSSLITAIGKIRSSNSFEFLKALAEDKHSQFRNIALSSIRTFKNKESFAFLEKMISDKEETEKARLDALKNLELVISEENLSMLNNLTNLENETIVKQVNRVITIISKKLENEKQEVEK